MAAEVTFRKFGFKTTEVENPVTEDVSTSPTLILRNHPDRVAYTVVNMGDVRMYCAFDERVSADRGIVLDANGGSLSVNAYDDGMLVVREVWARTASGTKKVYVQEVNRVPG